MTLTSIEIDDKDTFDLLFHSQSHAASSLLAPPVVDTRARLTPIAGSPAEAGFVDSRNQHSQDISKVYVDVGAYNGDTIDKALKIDPSLRIIAIEPIKSLCDDMQLKYESNPNIHIVNKAASSSNHQSQIELYEYAGGSKGLSTLNPLLTIIRPQSLYTNNIQTYQVQCDTLDNILESRNITQVDYLKIDVEGSEHNVLEGFTKYYHKSNHHTRFHIESHIINLENILHQLLEMNKNVNIEKITLYKEKITIIKNNIVSQTHINNHILGTIIGEF